MPKRQIMHILPNFTVFPAANWASQSTPLQLELQYSFVGIINISNGIKWQFLLTQRLGE
jgi:hypothetical protein